MKRAVTLVTIVIMAGVVASQFTVTAQEKSQDVKASDTKPGLPDFCTKDGIFAKTPEKPGDTLQMCPYDFNQLQNRVLISNSLHLQAENLRMKADSLDADAQKFDADTPKLVDDLYTKYGLAKDKYDINQQLLFQKKKN